MTKLLFCTLFDSSFLSRGLSLLESLYKNCPNFHIYIFAFDSEVGPILRSLKLNYVTIIELEEFEDSKLLGVKDKRSRGEYCWTCTPFVIDYCLRKFDLDHCIYLDADLFFFSNPRPIVEKFLCSRNSVLITPHNYTSIYDQSITSGIYCVQFMPFKNDKNGNNVLNWWKERCLEWCFARFEDGKFGDQKYLDSWPQQFDGVYVEKSLSFALGPWNVQNRDVIERNKSLYLAEDGLWKEIVFYHFHDFKFYWNQSPGLGGYYLPFNVIEKIYKPYIDQHLKLGHQYPEISSAHNPYGKVWKNNKFGSLRFNVRQIRDYIKLWLDERFRSLSW